MTDSDNPRIIADAVHPDELVEAEVMLAAGNVAELADYAVAASSHPPIVPLALLFSAVLMAAEKHGVSGADLLHESSRQFFSAMESQGEA